MDEPFEIPVMYRGEELLLPAKFALVGYTHRFIVEVQGQEVWFEPDEEKNYRAIIDPQKVSDKVIKPELLKAIAEAIEGIV